MPGNPQRHTPQAEIEAGRYHRNPGQDVENGEQSAGVRRWSKVTEPDRSDGNCTEVGRVDPTPAFKAVIHKRCDGKKKNHPSCQYSEPVLEEHIRLGFSDAMNASLWLVGVPRTTLKLAIT